MRELTGRRLLAALLLVVSGLVLAGCGVKAETAAVEQESAAEAVNDDPHAHHAPAAALPPAALPGTSLYHLRSAWTDQSGQDFVLSELRGRPAVFVMFYGDCTTACPLLVRSAELIEEALPADVRGAVEFVMVTFDTTRDSPEKLRAYAESKGLDRDGWRWLVGSDLQTRQLAALLGVQYRDAGNGMFAHTNVVTVLDADGVPIVRLEGLGVELDPAIEALATGG
ncbi:MAG: SCO family protein [Trueperaceae bacterium]|nr:SCO family protein [Trueperaceae bacterium]